MSEQREARNNTFKYWLAAAVLSFCAAIKVCADVLGWQTVSAVAAVSHVAPAMKVFTAHQGYETYSSKYRIEVVYRNGQHQQLLLSPENYQGLRGPYNRRNVYGALIAYGPLLVSQAKTQAMWEQMAQRGFCDAGGVLQELGFAGAQIATARIDYLHTHNPLHYARSLAVRCPMQPEVLP